MKRLLLLYTFFFLYLSILKAQTNPLPSSEILLNLQKLNTIGSVLYIAAHPDDENTRLLGYLARERKLRTGYLSITRGDGGQNLIGKEQGEALGLIRTQELLAARRIDKAEQFFTRANDFGYSKNPEETLNFWNKDSILADVVWIIRQFKPDVIICRFPTTGEGGHGHHTASAILAEEAFIAAADPKQFPEQLAYVDPWQTKRLFWNTFNFGTTNTTANDQLKIDVGAYNSLIGKGYGEIAAESRSMHKSQGFGSAKQRGNSIEFFKQLKGDTVKNDLFENIHTNWARFKNTETFDYMLTQAIRNFDARNPERSISTLINFYKTLESNKNQQTDFVYWKNQKLKETEELILTCSGLWLEATAADYIGIPGTDAAITTQIIARNPAPIKLNSISYFSQQDTTLSLELKTNELYSFKHKEPLKATLPFSTPYWLTAPHGIGRYVVSNPLLRGKPENEVLTTVTFNLTIEGTPLAIKRSLVYKQTDPVKGEVYRSYEILPPATVNISEKVAVFNDASPKKIHFTIKANTANISGKLQLQASGGWNILLPDPNFTLVNKGDEIILEAGITPSNTGSNSELQATLLIDNNSYSKNIQRIEYDHIPYQFILNDATCKLVRFDLKKGKTNIGYIPGAGDDIPNCLEQIGYKVTILTDDKLTNDDLSQYNSIITGVRAYNTNERLQVHYDKLMNYIKNGGNLIVQYNTNNRIGPIIAKIGPYPFNISRNRVTDEKAEVQLINKKHAVLNYPNKITPTDFEGWIQERGIYFATDSDKNYESILSMNDKGEKANEGALIIAKYGKGNFVYTGLVFFRELPAGVPGAYRLFTNLLSIPKNN